MWRITDRLETRDEKGRLRSVVVMRNGVEVDYVMADGTAVTRRQDGTFCIDETGETLSLDC